MSALDWLAVGLASLAGAVALLSWAGRRLSRRLTDYPLLHDRQDSSPPETRPQPQFRLSRATSPPLCSACGAEIRGADPVWEVRAGELARGPFHPTCLPDS